MATKPPILQNNSVDLNSMPNSTTSSNSKLQLLHSPPSSNMLVSKTSSRITLPKIISVFGKMPEGKIKKCTYIVEKGSAKNMSMIINEIKILLGLPRNDQTEWKLSDVSGNIITKSSDLYLQESATFMLTSIDSPQPILASSSSNSNTSVSKTNSSSSSNKPANKHTSKSGLATLRSFTQDPSNESDEPGSNKSNKFQPNNNNELGNVNHKPSRRNSTSEVRKLDWVYGKSTSSFSNGLNEKTSQTANSKKASVSTIGLPRKSSKPSQPRKVRPNYSNQPTNSSNAKSLSIDKPAGQNGLMKLANSNPRRNTVPVTMKRKKKTKTNPPPEKPHVQPDSEPMTNSKDNRESKPRLESESSQSGHLPTPPVIGKADDEPFYLKLGQGDQKRKPLQFASSFFGDSAPQPVSKYRPDSAISKFYPEPDGRSSSKATFILGSSFHPSLSSSTLSSFDTDVNASSSDTSVPPNPLMPPVNHSKSKSKSESELSDSKHRVNQHNFPARRTTSNRTPDSSSSSHNKSILKGPDSAQSARRILKLEEATELQQHEERTRKNTALQKSSDDKPSPQSITQLPDQAMNRKTVRFASRPVTLETIYSTKSQRKGPSFPTRKKPKVYYLPNRQKIIASSSNTNKPPKTAAPIGTVKSTGFGNFAQPTMASLRKTDMTMTKVDVAA